ncbi:RND family efflux transporter, MFP subunit [Roseovarius nanhaiticus]|uniref:RND family efflux transporter, MFP subunit n=1 Tax=Roseovarius nanhaiticus TaxID=573024 RepID=A0A1N7FDP5_9RHOB|nr:efflux RND transporter periplasmic adaptor subunit [Roseovarius nanhaiticus]SEK56891.1 RND family efflux transporter, MFP subunit [Roseovarius nanhaiticus]SIR98442.1 RND family efflux transporter, MFP subunit [Roseovarius nanhaiticus]
MIKAIAPALFALGLALIQPAHAQDAEAPVESEPLRPVKLMTLEAGAGDIRREFYGRVRARETVHLAFQVGGQITQFPVDEGAPLEEGALIAQLNLTPFRREVARAQVDLEKAERDVTRLSKLAGNAVAEVEVRNAETTADLARIRAEEAQEALEDATLKTQFDALVARREVANFTTVSPGEPVVLLHDMSELRVDVSVPEVLFRRERSQGVTFEASFPGGSETYPLALREFEAETADVAQTYEITLGFPGDVPGWVLPGASVTVVARAARQEGAQILIPETALSFNADRQPGLMVFAPDGDGDTQADQGTVTWTPVTIEMRDDTRVHLVDGPAEGTEIVAAGAAQLRDGQKVRRFKGLAQ